MAAVVVRSNSLVAGGSPGDCMVGLDEWIACLITLPAR